MDIVSKAFLEVSHLDDMAGLSVMVASGCRKAKEGESECEKPRKLVPTAQPCMKQCVDITENSNHSALFLKKVFCGL